MASSDSMIANSDRGKSCGGFGRAAFDTSIGPAMKTDSLFYRLFQALPRLFFDLVGLPTLPAEQYRFQSVELKQTALRLDGLFRPPVDRPDLPLFFIEMQFQPTQDLYPRLFAELPLPQTIPAASPLAGGGDLSQPRCRSRGSSSLCHPTPQCSGPPDLLGSVGQVSPNLLPMGPKALILDLIETILVYKLPALSRKEIQTMLVDCSINF